MGSLMLVNPKKRRSRRRGTRKNPRKMSAKQRRYFGRSRKHRSSHAVRANPRRHKRRSRRRIHRNPISSRGVMSGARGFLKGSLLPAVIGGAGALAVDVAWAFAPFPTAVKTGNLAPIAKIAGAVALGYAVTKFGKQKAFGQAMVAGYLTVTAYDMLKKLLARTMPTLPLSEYPYDLGYASTGGQIPDESGVSAYLSGPEGYGLTEGDHVGAYMDGYGDDVS